MNGPECRPQALVAEGGTDGTGSPGVGGVRAASGRLKSDVKLSHAFVLVRRFPCHFFKTVFYALIFRNHNSRHSGVLYV